MRSLLSQLCFFLVFFTALSVTAFSAGRNINDRPAKKNTNVNKVTQKTSPRTKTTPKVQDESQPVLITPQTSGIRAGEEINWQVLASGGGRSMMGSMILGSTIGQAAAGLSTMGGLTLNSGFQQNFSSGGSGGCCVGPIRGDVNYDGASTIDISDLIYLINYMFQSGPEPICFEEADINGDGAPALDISDLIWLIDYMFQSGPEPMPCS